MSSNNETAVTQKDLHELLEIFEKKAFEAAQFEEGTTEFEISKKCEALFKLDYSLIELDNSNGLLSTRYPARIFIPEYEHGHSTPWTNCNGNGNGNRCNGHGGCSSGATSSTATPSGSSYDSNCSNGVDTGGGDGCDGYDDCENEGIQAFVTFANPLHNGGAQATPPVPTTSAIYPQSQQLTQPASVSSTQQQQQQNTIYEDLYDIQRVRELITLAKYARCRQRFVVPVLMYRGKLICRSATLSVMPETYGRKVVDYAYDCLSGSNSSAPNDTENDADSTEESLINQINEQSAFSYDEVIKSDIQLLNTLNVTTIVDLMVENRKIKYFMAVSSSEKADPNRHYQDFNILSLPYPGCEFFKKFRDNNYVAKNLLYNWTAAFNDASLSVPNSGPAAEMEINWSDYQNWDLICITQNYLKATLRYIQEDNSGLLIHCISGWDRTPLFISLVRLSLWADGLIHQSLSPIQMAYFTMAYDWFLFGHQLPDRLKRGEDIMFFCFHILKYISEEDFSIAEHRKRTKTSSSSGSSVIVIKSDCSNDEEPQKEDYMISFDQDSNDSFSNCDMSIQDNFYATTATTAPVVVTNIINRSPNTKRTSRTSPISVPTSGSAARQRHESTSSTGSWQVVTETGSIDSLFNGSYMQKYAAQQQQAENNIPNGSNGQQSNGGASTSSGCCSNNSGNTSGNTSSNCNGGAASGSATHGQTNGSSNGTNATRQGINVRKQRLNAVRAIFIQSYGKTIGLKFREGSSMNLGSFIGNLAEQIF